MSATTKHSSEGAGSVSGEAPPMLKSGKDGIPREGRALTQAETQQLFLPYRSFCARKGIIAKEVVLHDKDIAGALTEYITANSIKTIVLGASTHGAISRAFRNTDVPSSIAKTAPDSCAVYTASKAKVVEIKSGSELSTPTSATSSTNSSMRQNVFSPHCPDSAKFRPQGSWKGAVSEFSFTDGSKNISPLNSRDYLQTNTSKRPAHGKILVQNSEEISESVYMAQWERRNESENPTPVESANSSYESLPYASNHNSPFGSLTSGNEPKNKHSATPESMTNLNLRVRTKETSSHSLSGSTNSGVPSFPSDISFELLDQPGSSNSPTSPKSPQAAEIDDELRRLKAEFKQTIKKYNAACQETVTAREKARDNAHYKSEELSKLEDAKQAQKVALVIVEREKQKCKAAVQLAQKAQRIAELESVKRQRAEMKFKHEAEEKQKAMDALARCVIQYRRYSIHEIEIATNNFSRSQKIGEGGYGVVYKATLDHTPVAVKVLSSDISQGQKQFQREVEVLSQMRHPHMVILLGACPEHGCLVYEYMENGSLEDRLNCRNGTPPLSWRTRIRIATEIATALNFLHQMRPEPLVHRDLKPANILLDKNLVSKISDVGLSRLIPPTLVDSGTQYHMTAPAGTFCYIDPEYQQTGMLGTKSDIYSLGVMLLQIITAKPAMGLTHYVENAIEEGQFDEILDHKVKDWPVKEVLSLAKLALNCCELRRKDRPDLDSVILPELERLKELGSEVKDENRLYYLYSQDKRLIQLPPNHVFLKEFGVKEFQHKGFPQESSSPSQETTNSNPEIEMETPCIYTSGSGSSTSTTLEHVDYSGTS
ncbi:U-box domain-containing protein 52-like [Dorcoceras hygrometricum]|uniref:RING-type E3 ubiquitin transferase n=1 Tax=Dorcoceras hygrometricum TaxID=472368 RepID=A0A2Z7ATS8_9LAMI|nr:U-box domain-containing protein 52-like [Dorcoceras hygrometricum]